MSYGKYSYYILCEDRAHFNFVYGYLTKKGVNSRKIYPAKDFPEGKRDAKNFVRLNYAEEIKKIHQRPVNTVLIVFRDADKENAEDIVDSFDNKNKNVFVASPKRNIETWFYYFHHKDDEKNKTECANETVDRKGGRREKFLYKHTWCGGQFVDIINGIKNGQVPLYLPPSLNATAVRVIEYEKNYHG